jgi:glucose-6-phosphate 1-dehydrogenase
VSKLPNATNAETPDDHIIVLFGATGDLAKRKIIPGLFHLAVAGLLPKRYRIIGSSPKAFSMSTGAFRQHALDAVLQFGSGELDGEAWKEFEKLISFTIADPDDAADLVQAIAEAENELGGNVKKLFHLAVPPNAVFAMIQMLGSSGLNKDARVICEKPFGTDLYSARKLNEVIEANFEESQVFRIDHFLAIEPPASFDAKHLHDEVYKVFESIRPLDPALLIRG